MENHHFYFCADFNYVNPVDFFSKMLLLICNCDCGSVSYVSNGAASPHHDWQIPN